MFLNKLKVSPSSSGVKVPFSVLIESNFAFLQSIFLHFTSGLDHKLSFKVYSDTPDEPLTIRSSFLILNFLSNFFPVLNC